MARILVCGGRDFENWDLLKNTLCWICSEFDEEIVIISGGAKGADTLALRFADEYKTSWERYKANWDLHGKAAGPIRNLQMLNEGKPDLVIAFPGGKGTAHMVKIAKAAGVEVREING